ncbi:hypothetical protein ES703_79266 [subsurface metagenome]
MELIRRYPQHRFYILTHCAKNLPKFSPFPDNCYVGATATDTDMMLDATRCFDEISAKVKFISFEPLLWWDNRKVKDLTLKALTYGRVNGVIVGAMTGTKKDIMELHQSYPKLTPMPWGKRWTLQPHVEWVEEVADACDRAGVSLFLKENLMPLFEAEGITKREDWTGIRQEMPEEKR